MGQKLAITSPKPQSTRKRVSAILTLDESQIILLDTPGILQPAYLLQEAMQGQTRQAIRDADVVLHLVDATAPDSAPFESTPGQGGHTPTTVITAFNKIDLIAPPVRANLAALHPDAAQLSANTGEGIEDLLKRLSALLPEGPFLYDPSEASTENLRFFAAELVRETVLEQLSDEVPYSVAALVEEFREDRNPIYIRIVLFVERESQKRIVIGHRGSRIREIGQSARLKIEELMGKPVYLDLWVKVLHDWRRDKAAVKRLGYGTSEEPFP